MLSPAAGGATHPQRPLRATVPWLAGQTLHHAGRGDFSMRPHSLLTFATVPLMLMALVACSSGRTVSFTYTKPNVTQQMLLDDEKQLRKTSGVEQVMTKIDDKNTARIDLILDENHKGPGLDYIIQMGYSQVRN
jgi:hypothetical protein